MMKRITLYACLWIGALMGTPAAQAASLGLLSSYPDFVLDLNAASSYSYAKGAGTTGTFTFTGLISTYTECASPCPANRTLMPVASNGTYLESFSLTAHINNTTGAFLDGSFTIKGTARDPTSPTTIVYNGANDATNGLLHGTLTNWGWSGSSNTTGTIEFTFNNPLGVIPSALPNISCPNLSPSASCGLILTVGSTTGGSFSAGTPFGSSQIYTTTSWTGTGTGDAFVVPVPAAFWLFGSGLALLGRFASGRAKSRNASR
jgi:hypothetical protein